MKKIKFLFVLLFIVNVVPFLSARDFESDCMSFFKELGLLTKESQSVNSNKMNVSYYFYKESKESVEKSFSEAWYKSRRNQDIYEAI